MNIIYSNEEIIYFIKLILDFYKTFGLINIYMYINMLVENKNLLGIF